MNDHTPNFSKSRELQAKAHKLVPGGCHTYAKGDDQYPVLAPGFIARGKGSRVWDVDGNAYIEYGMGNRAVGLGHSHPAVLDAVARELAVGCNFTRPSPIEVTCAERFLSLIDRAEMVKFCKSGSDATSGAIRLARAYTGRDLIACCGDHPFFSIDDWFIGTTAMNAGIPEAVRNLTLKFRYNDLDSVRELFNQHPGQIAALILEPARTDDPNPGYLEALRGLCHENGALFVLDEMITGFRWHNKGAQERYGITPDLSCFGKALGNGFAISALAGRREYMRLGGLDQFDKPRVFLLSSTHGAETHAMAAAIATMDIYSTEPVIEHTEKIGGRLATEGNQIAAHHGLSGHFRINGPPQCLVYSTLDSNHRPCQGFRSLFLQETIRRGILMPSLVVSYAHNDDDVDRTLEAIDGALSLYARALNDGYEAHLMGRPSQIVYRAFNTPAHPSLCSPHP